MQRPLILIPNDMSNEKRNGYLLYVGDYTTQLYRDSNKQL